MGFPYISYGTPRKLPKPQELLGRVVVLDIAFAADAQGASFETITKPFLEGLGERLAMWIDHHDHRMHAAFAGDSRFILRTKAEHGACPELVTASRIMQAGVIDTICCHVDFDGLCSAAKWIRRGEEPYLGADDDARAIDTRLGTPSELAATIDRALRARPRDELLKGRIVRFLAAGAVDRDQLRDIEHVAAQMKPYEDESRRLAMSYQVEDGVAVVDARNRRSRYDKTSLLLLGQERAPISVVYDESALTAAARFDSGIDLVGLLGLEGGMPTVVTVSPSRLSAVLKVLRSYKSSR
jgi:hypothetical protein